jgi:UDPglucose 6-dehydrogenase
MTVMFRVGFIGTGKLGLPCAEIIAEQYFVEGYDIDTVWPANFKMVSDLSSVVAGKDIIFLAVPTPHDLKYGGETPTSHLPPKDFDYSIVKRILQELNQYTTEEQLVVLISTVLPGTTRCEFIPLVKNFRFIYNPYLIAMGSVKHDMVNPEMIIIGTEDGILSGDAELLINFYKPLLKNNPRIEVGTWDEAECIKIFYNTFISAKIGLVNMIQDVAEKTGNINVDIVTNALSKSTQRIMGPAYMKAGLGDAGACHPRDNIALRFLAERLELGYDLFGTIMESREIQAENLAKRLIALANEYDLKDIWIHGKAYKPNVPYIDGSYSLLVGHYVEKLSGIKPKYVDPLTDDKVDKIKGVVLMAHHAPTTYAQEKAQAFYCEILPGSVILDPWRYLTNENIEGIRIIQYGNTRNKNGRET